MSAGAPPPEPRAYRPHAKLAFRSAYATAAPRAPDGMDAVPLNGNPGTSRIAGRCRPSMGARARRRRPRPASGRSAHGIRTNPCAPDWRDAPSGVARARASLPGRPRRDASETVALKRACTATQGEALRLCGMRTSCMPSTRCAACGRPKAERPRKEASEGVRLPRKSAVSADFRREIGVYRRMRFHPYPRDAHRHALRSSRCVDGCMWRKEAGCMGRPRKNVERIGLEKHRNAAAMGAQVTPAGFDLQTVFSHRFRVSRRAVDVARSAALLPHRDIRACECGGAHAAYVGRCARRAGITMCVSSEVRVGMGFASHAGCPSMADRAKKRAAEAARSLAALIVVLRDAPWRHRACGRSVALCG